MKITVSYKPDEDPEAAAVVAVLLDKMPGVRVRKNGVKDGYYHTFLTTKKPEKPRNFKDNP